MVLLGKNKERSQSLLPGRLKVGRYGVSLRELEMFQGELDPSQFQQFLTNNFGFKAF